jgi:hypothetical protein
MREFISIKEVLNHLISNKNIISTEWTIRRHVKQKKLQGFKEGKEWKVNPNDLERWIDKYFVKDGLKRCSQCGVEKPLDQFSKNRSNKNGHTSWCKLCCKIKRDLNRGRGKEYNKEYYLKNKDKIKARSKKYAESHKEELILYHIDYYKKNPNYKPNYKKKYMQTPSGRMVQYRSIAKRRAIKKGIECNLTFKQWEKLIELQENRCVICGKNFTKKNPATKDHIIPVIHDGPFTMENTQAVHKSCNCRKNARIDKSNIVSWVARPDLCVMEGYVD